MIKNHYLDMGASQKGKEVRTYIALLGLACSLLFLKPVRRPKLVRGRKRNGIIAWGGSSEPHPSFCCRVWESKNKMESGEGVGEHQARRELL